MANKTPRFGLTTFDSKTDTLALQGYKAFGADRETLDRLLTYVIEKHTHTGIVASTTPPAAPSLTVASTGGTLLPNRAVYYRASSISARGQEHAASLPAVAYTPAQLDAPATAPTLSPGAGSLLPGDYLYAVSAFTNTTDRETLISRTVAGSLTIPGGFELSFPPPPSGATGWNIYRKGPTDYELRHLAAMDIDAGSFSDDNLRTPSRLRGAPTVNASSTSASIEINVEGFESGATCKIYRSYDPGNWENSLLTWTAVMPFLDTGIATRTGYPPAANATIGGAPPIDLVRNTTGNPPPGLVHTTTEINFTFLGPIQVSRGAWQYVNEYDALHLLGLRVNLGRDSTPAALPVIVALDYRPATGGSWVRYRSSVTLTGITAEIPVGESIGSRALDDVAAVLGPGDALRPVILQSGGGATPTDENLAVTVIAAVAHGPTDTTYLWET